MIQLIVPAFVLFDVHSIWQGDERGRDPSLVEQLRDDPDAASSGRCHTCAGCHHSHESTGSSCRIPGSALGICQSAYGSYGFDERKAEGAPNGGCYTTHGREAEEDGSEAAEEEERCSLQWRIHFDVPDLSILKTDVTDPTSSSEAAAATEDVFASYVAAGGEFETTHVCHSVSYIQVCLFVQGHCREEAINGRRILLRKKDRIARSRKKQVFCFVSIL